MRTETELRELLRAPGDETTAIDVDAVLRRSRRRRAPRQAALRGTVTLAVLGIGIAGISGLRPFGMAASSDSAEERVAPASEGGSGGMSESDSGSEPFSSGVDPTTGGTQQAPAYKLHPCGGQLAEVAPSDTGLVLSPVFDSPATATESPIDGTVRLTNTGGERVSGVTAATPAVTVSQEGLVLWHSNGMMIMMAAIVDLEPGESMDYRASFTPVQCGSEDEATESFRDDLPTLPPGRYQLSAAIDFTPDSDSAVSSLITGPPTSIELR